jgi:hypothetical protein
VRVVNLIDGGILQLVTPLQPTTRGLATCLLAVMTGSTAFAQTGAVHLDAQLAVYGDNTEFSNPFRTGETLFGAFGTVTLDAALGDRLTLRAGAFGHQRFGSDDAFDEVRPVLALVIGGARSRLVLGTLETLRAADRPGPDRLGPHGLLPPIQRETLVFERPWEAGLQWLVETPRVQQDAWVNWQRVASAGRREVFDAGITSRVRLRQGLTFRGEGHLVHQGGQVRASDPVGDSWATAAGVEAAGSAGVIDRVSVEALALLSRHVPNREDAGPRLTGFGTFLRVAVEERGWRAHAILWRGDDVVKREGDPHYLSVRADGTRYLGLRDYLETGLTRRFALAPRSHLEASVRWHRVEQDYEYSFRVMAVAHLRRKLAG